MKRIYSILLTVVLLILAVIPISAAYIGQVIGQALWTDIVATVEGHPIRAYNVGGYMAVVAEDLRDYGFDVIWSQADRTLNVIYRYDNPDPNPYHREYVPEKPAAKIGTPRCGILYTDIVTYLDGDEVESFNIDGETLIYFRELGHFGEVIWNQSTRTSNFIPYGKGLTSAEKASMLKKWSVTADRNDFSRPVTGICLEAVVKMNDNDEVELTVVSDPGGRWNLTVTETGFRLQDYTFGTPDENDPYYKTAYYDALMKLFDLGLPNIEENYLNYKNTPEQKEAVRPYVRVTVSGKEVTGDCWIAWGNGHTDRSFDFDAPVALNPANELRIWIGEED